MRHANQILAMQDDLISSYLWLPSNLELTVLASYDNIKKLFFSLFGTMHSKLLRPLDADSLIFQDVASALQGDLTKHTIYWTV